MIAELKRRTAKRGIAKTVAHDTGISLPVIYGVRNGKVQVSLAVAEALGFRLRWERITDDDHQPG